jgi:hypothetical protein
VHRAHQRYRRQWDRLIPIKVRRLAFEWPLVSGLLVDRPRKQSVVRAPRRPILQKAISLTRPLIVPEEGLVERTSGTPARRPISNVWVSTIETEE